MPWIKVDDHFDEHPKMARCGPLGIALWLAGLAYCNRNLTDGFVPWSTAKSLLTWEFLRPHPEDETREIVWSVDVGRGMHGEQATCEFVAELLVDSGLWEEVPGGYRVHDYLDYNPSRTKVLAERKEWADKKARYRKSNGVSPLESRPDSPVDSGPSPSRPVPVPVPVSVPSFKKGSNDAKSRRGDAVTPLSDDAQRGHLDSIRDVLASNGALPQRPLPPAETDEQMIERCRAIVVDDAAPDWKRDAAREQLAVMGVA